MRRVPAVALLVEVAGAGAVPREEAALVAVLARVVPRARERLAAVLDDRLGDVRVHAAAGSGTSTSRRPRRSGRRSCRCSGRPGEMLSSVAGADARPAARRGSSGSSPAARAGRRPRCRSSTGPPTLRRARRTAAPAPARAALCEAAIADASRRRRGQRGVDADELREARTSVPDVHREAERVGRGQVLRRSGRTSRLGAPTPLASASTRPRRRCPASGSRRSTSMDRPPDPVASAARLHQSPRAGAVDHVGDRRRAAPVRRHRHVDGADACGRRGRR